MPCSGKIACAGHFLGQKAGLMTSLSLDGTSPSPCGYPASQSGSAPAGLPQEEGCSPPDRNFLEGSRVL